MSRNPGFWLYHWIIPVSSEWLDVEYSNDETDAADDEAEESDPADETNGTELADAAAGKGFQNWWNWRNWRTGELAEQTCFFLNSTTSEWNNSAEVMFVLALEGMKIKKIIGKRADDQKIVKVDFAWFDELNKSLNFELTHDIQK